MAGHFVLRAMRVFALAVNLVHLVSNDPSLEGVLPFILPVSRLFFHSPTPLSPSLSPRGEIKGELGFYTGQVS